jgi:hypothetical protein
MKSIEDKQYHKKLLELEGLKFTNEFTLDLKKYLWNIDSLNNIK